MKDDLLSHAGRVGVKNFAIVSGIFVRQIHAAMSARGLWVPFNDRACI